MYEIRVQPKSAHELARQQQSLSKSRPQAHSLSAIHFMKAITRISNSTGILVMILVGCMSIAVSGCGGLVVDQGAGASPTKAKGKTPGSPYLSQISCGTQSLTGPQTKGCSVYLNSAAVTSFLVSLKSNNPAVTVPLTATVSVGSNSAGFTAAFAGVKSTQSVTLAASAGSVSTTTVIQLYPTLITSPDLSSISCGTQSLTGPQTKACSVYLNAPAQSSVLVSLSSDNPAVTLPRSVTIVAGATSGGFSVTAAAVNTPQTVTLTASSNGASRADVLMQLLAQTRLRRTTTSGQLNWDAPTTRQVPLSDTTSIVHPVVPGVSKLSIRRLTQTPLTPTRPSRAAKRTRTWSSPSIQQELKACRLTQPR